MTLRKVSIIILALGAMFSILAVLASSASAEETFLPVVFLVKGSDATKQTAKAAGKLLLEDSKLSTAVTCAVEMVGHFEGPEAFEVTAVLAEGKEYNGKLEGKGFHCKTEKGCAETTEASPIEVWPINLATLHPELGVHNNSLYILALLTAGYAVLCLVLGITVEETCVALEGSGTEVFNTANNIETTSGTSVTPSGNCTMGGEGTYVNTTLELIELTSEEGKTEIAEGPTLAPEGEATFGVVSLLGGSKTIFYRLIDPAEQLELLGDKITALVGGEFTLANDHCETVGLVLLKGEACTVEVTFKPTQDPQSTADLEVSFEELGTKFSDTLKAELFGEGD